MNYLEWAEQYFTDARRIHAVIEKKRALLKSGKLTPDARKTLSDTIITYRCIYRELLRTAQHLKSRAEVSDAA